jgi:hypothetical protein
MAGSFEKEQHTAHFGPMYVFYICADSSMVIHLGVFCNHQEAVFGIQDIQLE